LASSADLLLLIFDGEWEGGAVVVVSLVMGISSRLVVAHLLDRYDRIRWMISRYRPAFLFIRPSLHLLI
jgi:hypothetical protein